MPKRIHLDKSINNCRNIGVSSILVAAQVLSSFCAEAATQFTYTGNNFTACNDLECSGVHHLSVSFISNLTENELKNMPFANITSSIVSYSFSDGAGLAVTDRTSGAYSDIQISTNSFGLPVAWSIGGYLSAAELQLQTNWRSTDSFHSGEDFVVTMAVFHNDENYGINSNDPGAWTVKQVSQVPETNSGTLFVVGIALLINITWHRRSRLGHATGYKEVCSAIDNTSRSDFRDETVSLAKTC